MGKVAVREALRFVIDCLRIVGTEAKYAEQQALMLIEADMAGHHSHGLNRLEYYVGDIKSGACTPNNRPKIQKETQSTAWVDANNVLGATSSHFAMDIAICKAKETGVGWVTVSGANHNGMVGLWSRKAADEGLIGLACCNTSPVMAPTRSKSAVLGTNPIAVSAPAAKGEIFHFDMATTAVAFGKVEMARRKGEKIPRGWALGPDGKETQDPVQAIKAFCMMPLGGSEMTSGYKGYCLSAMVDLFCGISSGAKYGHHIERWIPGSHGKPSNRSQCFVAVNPGCFAPGFGDRLTDIIQFWRQMEPADPKLPILAPGDKEKKARAEACASGTVSYVKHQIESSANLARNLNVKPMEVDFS